MQRKAAGIGPRALIGAGLGATTPTHYIDGQIHEIVSAKKGSGGYRWTRTAAGFDEVALPNRYLGA